MRDDEALSISACQEASPGTSAREAITILGMQGHHVEVCDPDPRCLGRFSRFVRRFHRCPGLGVDPAGYVIFVLALLARRRFDVLLPIHEQGHALSKIREAVKDHVAVALPSHAAYQKAHSKASFSRLLSELGLPQPRTRRAETELGYLPHRIDDALADAVAWLTRREAVDVVRPRVSA